MRWTPVSEWVKKTGVNGGISRASLYRILKKKAAPSMINGCLCCNEATLKQLESEYVLPRQKPKLYARSGKDEKYSAKNRELRFLWRLFFVRLRESKDASHYDLRLTPGRDKHLNDNLPAHCGEPPKWFFKFPLDDFDAADVRLLQAFILDLKRTAKQLSEAINNSSSAYVWQKVKQHLLSEGYSLERLSFEYEQIANQGSEHLLLQRLEPDYSKRNDYVEFLRSLFRDDLIGTDIHAIAVRVARLLDIKPESVHKRINRYNLACDKRQSAKPTRDGKPKGKRAWFEKILDFMMKFSLWLETKTVNDWENFHKLALFRLSSFIQKTPLLTKSRRTKWIRPIRKIAPMLCPYCDGYDTERGKMSEWWCNTCDRSFYPADDGATIAKPKTTKHREEEKEEEESDRIFKKPR